jgi:hypothetical protein
MMGTEEAGSLKTVKKYRKVRLQSREYEVLSELDKWGLLGLAQLEGLLFRTGAEMKERIGLFFNDYDEGTFDRYSYKRLLLLEKAGCIERFFKRFKGWKDLQWAYGLTRRGKTVLEQARTSRGKLDFRRTWSNNLVFDYILMNGAGLVLAKILRLKVTSRHQLAREMRPQGLSEVQIQSRIPDLRIEGKWPLSMMVRIGGSWVAHSRRWLGRDIHLWLYLTPELATEPVLWRARAVGARHVYVAGLKDFRENLGGTVFRNCRDRTATLDQLTGDPGAPWGA